MSLQTSPEINEATIINRCKAARTLEESGEYEQGRAALGAIWKGLGTRPDVDELSPATAAEVLLITGSLTGWLGYAKQAEGAQEEARDLISEAVRIFDALGQPERVAEGRSEMAYCYWRTKELGEARALLESALPLCGDGDVKAVAVIRLAIVDASESNHKGAIERLTEIADVVARSKNSSVKGRFYVNLATFEKNLSKTERSEELTDRALIHYAAGGIYFEEIRHKSFIALTENQLGYLHFIKGRFKEAHEHLERARKAFARLRHSTRVYDVDETRARAFLAEGRNGEAELAANSAVRGLEKGEAFGELTEALITQATAQARNGRCHLAAGSFRRAVELAETQGALEAAARACVAALEELAGRLSPEEAGLFYDRADELISPSEHGELFARLRAVTKRLVRSGEARVGSSAAGGAEALGLRLPGEKIEWEGFSLKEQEKLYERLWIIAALRDGGGVPTRAARLLGFRNHESLIGRINSKHPDLAVERSEVRPRRKRGGRGRRRSSGAGLPAGKAA